MSESAAQSLLSKKVDPTYPPSARSAKVQGTVVLKVEINKAGIVQNVNLVSGHPLLAPAAMDAVKQWKYKPYVLKGDPVDVETTVQVNFTLEEEEAAPGSAGGIIGTVPGGMLPGQTGAIGAIASSSPTQLPSVAPPTRIRVSSGVMRPFLRTKVNPTYPTEAKTEHIEGMVVLQVNIDKDGNVNKVEAVSGPSLLIPAAVEAVKQWKYKPFLMNKNPIEVETTVKINFVLLGKEAYSVIVFAGCPPGPDRG